jgi:tRNA/rRNA methyltransferase/tRNA (cytidine32/uridine32-2'-O)-methyltransferase
VSALDNVCVVLVEPQDPVNIAGVVRAMKNMGVRQLRLVNPVEYDPSRVERVAHDTRDIVSEVRHFASLDEAIADCVFAAGFTARRRKAKWKLVSPREVATPMLAAAAEGPVAIFFGREDHGLSNESLDRAHAVVTIPTSDHPSLNLAQAVLIALYELHIAANASRTIAPPRKDAPPASAEQLERYFADADKALATIDFFRTRNEELVLRSLRSLTYRAAPDAREIDLMRSIAIEVMRAIERASSSPRDEST